MDIDREKIEQSYHRKGLETRYIEDEPGFIYAPHSHEQVMLFTLKGSARIKLDGSHWISTTIGKELTIQSGQLHEAIVNHSALKYGAFDLLHTWVH